MEQTAAELYAELYDLAVSDWAGEVDFYRELVANLPSKEFGLLEVACGTGRVALRLARADIHVTGVDLSPELLEVARRKSAGIPHLYWIQGDMRTFQLSQKFAVVIIPGHSFQFMLTPDDQVQCLENIKRHLIQDGLLIIHLDHQDFSWLGELVTDQDSFWEVGQERVHPTTGQKIRSSYYWVFEPLTQTATVRLRWEGLADDGTVAKTWEMNPMPLHCLFRFEMEHLLKRVGFTIEAVYGDFYKSNLTSQSSDMIWVVKNKIY